MRAGKYIYAYDKFIIVKMYCNKKVYQKVFTVRNLQKAVEWRDNKLKELGKVGKYHPYNNKYNFPCGITLRTEIDKRRKRSKRLVLKVSGGYMNGKHLQTTVSVKSRGIAEALQIAVNKREQFIKLKRELNLC